MKNARIAFAVIAWVFVGLVIVQVFLAGAGLFGASNMEAHVGLGYGLQLAALLVLVAAALSRSGRLVRLSSALLLVTVIQTILPALRQDLPIVAALHPLNALLIAGLGLVIARGATALVREPTPETVEGRAPATEKDGGVATLS